MQHNESPTPHRVLIQSSGGNPLLNNVPIRGLTTDIWKEKQIEFNPESCFPCNLANHPTVVWIVHSCARIQERQVLFRGNANFFLSGQTFECRTEHRWVGFDIKSTKSTFHVVLDMEIKCRIFPSSDYREKYVKNRTTLKMMFLTKWKWHLSE